MLKDCLERSSRMALKQDWSRVKWNLLVSSAKTWIECEAISMETDDAGRAEARRIRANVQSFERWMGEWWGGAGVLETEVMMNMARMENMEGVHAGLFETVDEAHFWSNSAAFRSRHLREPNGDLNPHQD